LIRAQYLLPVSDYFGRTQRIADGYVLYQDGKILEVGAFHAEIGQRILQKYQPLQVIGLSHPAESLQDLICLPGVLLPGFVKAHGHDHESPIIGIVKDVPLTLWLDGAVNVFTKFMEERGAELERKIGQEPHLITYYKARLDDIYYGITSCLVHHCNYNKYHLQEIMTVNEQAGTRMIVAIGSQDRNYYDKILDRDIPKVLQRMDEYWELAQHCQRTSIIPGPDQFFSNGPELLKALKKWANDHGILIHIHSSEEYNTTEWFKQQYGMTEVEYAYNIGFLDERTLLAHQVHCTEQDLVLLQKSKAKIVHNPLANTILGSGMPPILRMLEMGIPVAISTDGSGSADSQNILAAARLASQYQKALHRDARVLPAQQALEMITIEPAKMLGLNCGSLEPGRDADMVLMDTRRPNLTPTKITNVVENLIWASDGSEARYVIAKGRILKDDYSFTTLNAAKVLQNVQYLSELLDDYKKTIGNLKGTGANQ